MSYYCGNTIILTCLPSRCFGVNSSDVGNPIDSSDRLQSALSLHVVSAEGGSCHANDTRLLCFIRCRPVSKDERG